MDLASDRAVRSALRQYKTKKKRGGKKCYRDGRCVSTKAHPDGRNPMVPYPRA